MKGVFSGLMEIVMILFRGQNYNEYYCLHMATKDIILKQTFISKNVAGWLTYNAEHILNLVLIVFTVHVL